MQIELNNNKYNLCIDPTVEQYSTILDIIDKIEIIDSKNQDMTDDEKYILVKAAYVNGIMRQGKFSEFLSLILEPVEGTYKDNKIDSFKNVKLSQVGEAIDFFFFTQTSLFPKLTVHLLKALRSLQENTNGKI